jgi:hypothetical protein
MRYRRFLLSFALVCAALAGASQGQPALVADGKPQAVIVTAETPARGARIAALELQAGIEKITGVKLPIAATPPADETVALYVGRSANTDALGVTADGLRWGAYRMVSGKNWLALLGDDVEFTPREPWIHDAQDKDKVLKAWDALTGDKFGNPMLPIGRSYSPVMKLWEQDGRGSINAVYAFLYDLGARWYSPGEMNEVWPAMKTVPLPKVDRTVTPDFPVRRMVFYYNHFAMAPREEMLWQLRQGLNGAHEGSLDGLLGLGAPGHGIENVLGREGAMEAHPEYFAIWGGKRVHAPCLSSEGLLKQTVKYLRAVYDVYDQPRVDISPTDGYGSLCQCDLCKGKSTPERGWDGQLSDYVWGFVDRAAREVAKTHPDRRVGCLAYTSYQQPPAKLDRLSPNISIVLCRWRANFFDAAEREEFRKLTQAWLDKLPSKELYIWEYYLHARPNGPWEGVPVYFPHIISDDLRFLKGKSKGEFMEVQRYYPDWKMKWDALAANHLNLYVTARLYWKADLDVDALLAEYYDKFYGPARGEMKAFVEFAEANWTRAAKDAAIIDKLVALLAAAREKAGDTRYGKRIDTLTQFMTPLVQRRDQLAKGRKDAPKVRAYYRDKAPEAIDGNLDKPFWQGMAVYPLQELETGREPAFAGSFKVACTEKNIYFGILCREPDVKRLPTVRAKPDDGNLFLGDSVEILLETQTHAYYQIAIDPAGAVVDLDRKKGIEMRWSANAEVATRVADGAWTVEVRIPIAGEGQEELDALNGVSGRMPSETHPWFFNVCRQRVRGDTMERSAFSSTASQSFHNVMKFAELYTR